LRKLLFFTFLSSIFLGGCRPDLDQLTWQVDALLPLLKTRIDFQDLQSLDSAIAAGDSGLIQLVFSNKIASLVPGEIAPPFNDIFERTATLKKITLGERVINNSISLGRIAGQAGLQGALLVAANGTSQVIPPLNNIGPSNFNIDATEFFQNLTLQDGWLVLRMENNFPIDISNIQYEIRNQIAGSFLIQNTLASLPAGAVHYDSVRLINNFLIEGQLVASLVNLDSPGSNGNSVLIDTSDAINLRLTLDKLDPVSATAVFPAQDLFNETGTAEISPPSALLTSVHVLEGKIFMDALSTIDDSVNLIYRLPGAISNGAVLEFLEIIPAAPFGSSVSTYVEIPVESYTLDLTGLPDTSNVYNTFYTIFRGGIDSTGRQINLSLDDSVYVQTGIKDLITDRGYGFLGYDTISGVERVAFDAFNEVLGGNFQLEDVQVNLEIENYIGAEFDFRIKDIISIAGTQNTGLQWNQLGFDFNINRAIEVSPGAIPLPGRLTIPLNNANSNIQDLIETLPDTFSINLEAFMNKGKSPTDFTQFLNINYGIEAWLNATVPLNLAIENLIFRDTIPFDFDDFDEDNQLNSGSIKVLASNHYPFAADLSIYIVGEASFVSDSLFAQESLAPGEISSGGQVLAAAESSVEIILEPNIFNKLRAAKQLIIELRFNTPDYPGLVEFNSRDYIELSLVGDFNTWRR
jgi:hypothetical protein